MEKEFKGVFVPDGEPIPKRNEFIPDHKEPLGKPYPITIDPSWRRCDYRGCKINIK